MPKKSEQGKLIVLEGTDGTGKATQTDLLAEKLEEEGYHIRMVSFPQYNTKSAGPVEEHINGKYGQAEEVDPYKASILFAVDRFDASFKIKKWLEKGYTVLANRYVASNMGHQGNKISDPQERKKFFAWLHNLEYEIFGIPKSDINIILHVEAKTAQQLAQNKSTPEWKGKTHDIYQDDLENLKKAEQAYLEIAEEFREFTLVECTENGQMMPREKILEIVWKEVQNIIQG